MGGGLDLALACDIRVASVNAAFAHPGARLRIITGWGGTQRLPTLVGRARAIEFFSTARRVASDKAVEIGLVSKVSDPVLVFAIKLANQFANKERAPNQARRPNKRIQVRCTSEG